MSLSVPGVFGQSTPLRKPEFNVASVKPYSSSEGSVHSIARDPRRVAYFGMTVPSLMREAFWLKVYPLAPGPDAQALLVETSRLAAGRETKELRIYALVPGKNRPKFAGAEEDGSAPKMTSIRTSKRPTKSTGRGHRNRSCGKII